MNTQSCLGEETLETKGTSPCCPALRRDKTSLRQTHITVLALGGQGTFEEQYENVRSTATQIAALVDQGLRVVIVHGNGPQIGATVIRHEMGRTKVPPLPLHACGAETQGFLGYIIQQSLQDELSKRQTTRSVATVVTQVLVDRNDPAFKHPSKPIGPFYTKEQRDTLLRARSDLVIESNPASCRRRVSSNCMRRRRNTGHKARQPATGGRSRDRQGSRG